MVRETTRSVALTALLIVAAAAGTIAFTGTVTAAQDGSIDADPADPGVESTHKTIVEITSNEAGNSLSTIYVNYSTDSAFDGDVSNVTWNETSGIWNTTWKKSVFANSTFAGTEFHNTSASEVDFQNVTETEIWHDDLEMEEFVVDDETLHTAILDDEKIKKEKKYLKKLEQY